MRGFSTDESCPQTAVPRLPAQLPQYEYLGYLGGGGMGEIYKARHVHLDRQVVIKWLRTDLSVSAQLESRFAREMLAVGQLNHPNIVAATDAGIAENRRYLVMEFIDGLDLTELCCRVGRLSIADAAEVMRQSAVGLAHAHGNGIIHRDIKPTNLMLATDGTVKLLDLGLALLQGDESATHGPLTRTDSGPFGTYDYMSPEQWNDSHDVDSRGDLYSLGCTFYFLLAGHAPYETPQHKSVTAKMRGHVIDPIPAIRRERNDVPRRLAAVIDRMLAKEPADRFQSGTELAAALAPFTDGSDLRSLIRAAHVSPDAANASSRTDPASATIVSGSSTDRDPRRARGAGAETAPISRAGTSIVPTPVRRGKTWWIAGGIGALGLMALGIALALPDHERSKPDVTGDANVTESDPNADTVVDDATGDAAVVEDSADVPAPVVLPRFKEIAEQTIREEQEFALLVAVEDQVALAGRFDFEVAEGAPAGMRIDPRTGVLRWTPSEDQGRLGAAYPVTVVAAPKDRSVARSEVTILVRVEEVNQPPKLAAVNGAEVAGPSPPTISAVEGQSIEVSLSATDADDPPNRLELTSDGLPGNARLVAAAGAELTWTLVWTPGEEHGGAGLVRVPLSLSDGVATEPISLVFDVTEVNEPPALTMIDGQRVTDEPIVVKAVEGTGIKVALAGIDVDFPRNTLTIEPVGELPPGAALRPDPDTPEHWELQWTPGEAVGGGPVVPIKLRVGDGSAFSEAHTLLVDVAEVNQPPVVALVDGRDAKPEMRVSAAEGKLLEVRIVVDDRDLPANPIDLETTVRLPAGARLSRDDNDPRRWILAWTPGEDFGGDDPIRIPLRARDTAPSSELVNLVVDVAETNAAPTFAMVGGAPPAKDRVHLVDAAEGSPLEVLLVATDADRPANPLQIVFDKPLPDGAAIAPVPEARSTWKLTWMPGEQFGGEEPIDLVLRVDDERDQSEAAIVRVAVKETNTAPELREITLQKLGPGEPLVLEIPVVDVDLPAQRVTAELVAPNLDARAELVTRNDQRMVRVTWDPDPTAHLGKTVDFALRVRDSGDPPLTVERRFQAQVEPYVTNSVGMQFALVPAGSFRMGNLNPELLQRLAPQPADDTKDNGDTQPRDADPSTEPANRTPVENSALFDPSYSGILPRLGGQTRGLGPDGKERKRPDPPPPDDLPVREIRIDDSYYLGAFEVTQAQYVAMTGENPSRFSREGTGADEVRDLDPSELAVETVTYTQAVEFCRLLSELPAERAAGRSYRLPTEVEWEYAARAGTETLFSTGDVLTSEQANFDGRFPTLGGKRGPFLARVTYGGGIDPRRDLDPNLTRQHPEYAPNGFGVHDMLGNVAEWCLDWYARDTYSGSFGLTGPPTGTERVVRGGQYRSLDYQCRCAARNSMSPNEANPRTGFRVVMTITPPPPQLPPRRE